jgi:CMP-N,N'-diacetyllegionaminic acid synthase
MILAIIPARGGSKGVPKKNIKSFCGKPLIAWTIEQGKKSKHIDKLVVSTDDAEIAAVSRKYGAMVIDRPKEFARDDSPTFDAIKHVIDTLKERGESYDIVILLEPTSPLRKDDDLDKAIDLFQKNTLKADALVSLGEVHLENPMITKVIGEDGFLLPFTDSKKQIYQRQQLPAIYFPYGVIYLSKTGAYLKSKTFYQEKTVPYLIERWQNYEIDDIYDFVVMEAVMKYREQTK